MKTILQVEDDPNDVFFLQHAMKKAGMANPIHVATDGQQAIDYLNGTGKFADRQKFPLPCLVLLDLKLPYVMGLEVLKWIRQQAGLAMPVILLTASGEEADIAAAYRLGANAFLTKPSQANKLWEMVKAIKDFWLTHNTLPHESLEDSPGEETASKMEAVVHAVLSSVAKSAANGRPVSPMRGVKWQNGLPQVRHTDEGNPRAAV
jgi:two-component system response regulator